ncbi:lysozyme [Parvularcula lutaonensis]|uniref:Lysozyme n=1 Tax=Parvularcula lutaonensis TaxID=491923 RepID=A0ABV7MB38_9PROT|nr:lysozyme [Parvularcula lutaonensis]GGY38944.1 hypothetical protein GCM10007148_04080 [Parvularcula lutaonensis]
MKISERGLELIKQFEGLELEAYQDIVGVWTIGYGHTSMAGPPEVVPGMEITEQEAEEILRRDLRQYEEAVERAVKVDITQNMFDALVSITYNIGINAMRNSTFIKRLNNKDYEGAAEAMLWWNKAGGKVVNGLKRRRAAEAALFLEGLEELTREAEEENSPIDETKGAPVEENSPRRPNLGSSRTVGGAAAAGVAGAVGAGSVLMRNDDDGEEETASEGDGSSEPEAPGDSGPTDETAQETPTDNPGTLPEPEEVTETTEKVFVSTFEDQEEAWDAIIIAAGVIAVIAAIYVILVRFDDWRNHKR